MNSSGVFSWSALRFLDLRGKKSEVIAPNTGLSRHIEHDAWVTTETGFRLPITYFATKYRFEHVARLSPNDYVGDSALRERDMTKARRSAPTHFLPRLERYSGRQLLRATETANIKDFRLVDRAKCIWDDTHAERKQARAEGQELAPDADLDDPEGPYNECSASPS